MSDSRYLANVGLDPELLLEFFILRRASAIYPKMRETKKDSAAATMDFQTINVRGRANKPGDFTRSDRWNRSPAFLKVGPGLYRRLDEKERAAFARLWQRGEDLLRRASFDAPQWDVLLSRQPGFSSAGSTPRPTRAQ